MQNIKLKDGQRYSLTIEVDGKLVACHGTFDSEADCFFVNGSAHSLPGRGDARAMRENSTSYSVGSVQFATPAKF